MKTEAKRKVTIVAGFTIDYTPPEHESFNLGVRLLDLQ